MATKITTAAQLAERCLDVAQNYKTLYVMGCFGAPMTAANKKRYTQNHTYNKQASRTAMINAASADTFGFDCVCLIKGLLWGWCGNTARTYGGASYAVNDVPDISADQMIAVCKNISTAGWADMEVGEALWCSGHIGVYIGNGLAVECTPSWESKVQVTAVKNIGAKAGYNARTWTKHGKLPYVSYTGETISTPSTGGATTNPSAGTTATTGGPATGDIVEFTGNTHYASSNATAGVKCKPGPAKVTAVAPSGKHPYHLIHTDGTSTVYGWVDAADISGNTGATQSAPSTSAPTTSTATKKATEAARSFDKALAGAYKVTASSGLHIRNGAGTNKASLAVLPKGTKARNYGYYTTTGGVKWLYVQVTYGGVQYTGFCSSQYLSK